MKNTPPRFRSFPTFVAIVTVLAGTLDGCGTAGQTSSTPSPDSHERLFIGTGEYSVTDDWHAILRVEEAEDLDSAATGAVTPDATIPVATTGDDDGIRLSFVHGIFLDEESDEMYVSALFTNAENSTDESIADTSSDTGSVGVIANAKTADGAQTLSRHLFGDQTQIIQPHGVWVDKSRDILYVANTFGGNILAFHNAAAADGNIAPDRVIADENKLQAPVFVYVDEASDRLFVANMNATQPPDGNETADEASLVAALYHSIDISPDFQSTSGAQPAILIYNDASTLNGDNVEPDIRIAGDLTRLGAGNNQTTHNVWYNSETNQVIAGHHTNEILFFDLSDVDLNPTTPVDLDLEPRVLKVNEAADDSDVDNWSVYGFFLLPEIDRLYVACGYASEGRPQNGTPPNQIKVYDGVSASDFSGIETPSRVIYWSSGDQYYPPQPLWVTTYESPSE